MYDYFEIYRTAIFQILMDESYYFFQNFRKQLLGTFRVWERNIGLSLMSQYPPYILEKYHVYNAINLLYNFEATLKWTYYHATMNNPYLRLLVTLRKRWCNFTRLTLRGRCEFDVTISTLHQGSHCNIWGLCQLSLLFNVEARLAVYCDFHAEVLRLGRSSKFDVAISPVQQQSFSKAERSNCNLIRSLCFENLEGLLFDTNIRME